MDASTHRDGGDKNETAEMVQPCAPNGRGAPTKAKAVVEITRYKETWHTEEELDRESCHGDAGARLRTGPTDGQGELETATQKAMKNAINAKL